MKKLTDEAAKLLGVVSDRAIAEMTGMTRSGVHRARMRKGITRPGPVDANLGGLSPAKQPKYVWSQHGRLLGTMSDVDLALKLGVARSAVIAARQRRGIPAYQAPDHKPNPADAERKRRQRERANAAGGRQVAVQLTAEEARALDALVADGRTQRDAIGAAILRAASE